MEKQWDVEFHVKRSTKKSQNKFHVKILRAHTAKWIWVCRMILGARWANSKWTWFWMTWAANGLDKWVWAQTRWATIRICLWARQLDLNTFAVKELGCGACKRVNGSNLHFFSSSLLLWTSPTKEFGSRARTYVPDNYRACTFFLYHLAGKQLFFSISVQVMYYT